MAKSNASKQTDLVAQRAYQYQRDHPGASLNEVDKAIKGRRQDIAAGRRLFQSETGSRPIPRVLRAASEGGTRGYKRTVFSRQVVDAVYRAQNTRDSFLRSRYERTKNQAVPRPDTIAGYHKLTDKEKSEKWADFRALTTQPWADREELIRRLGRDALAGKPRIKNRDQREAAARRLGEQALGPQPWGSSP
jgi:hypothetical protein